MFPALAGALLIRLVYGMEVDWTVVVSVVGVVFAVMIAVSTSIIGNTIMGKYQLKIRKYELFFEKRCDVYTAFLNCATRIWSKMGSASSFNTEFESVCINARLFASPAVSSAILKLESQISTWEAQGFQENAVPAIADLFKNVLDLMGKELAGNRGRR